MRHRLTELGFHLNQDELNIAYERFVKVADKKKEVYDEDLMAIVEDEIRDFPLRFVLDYLHTVSGTGTVPSATVRIGIDGKNHVQESAWGDGPVDATYRAIKKATDNANTKVEDYTIRGVTGGAEAMGEVTVNVSCNGRDNQGTRRFNRYYRSQLPKLFSMRSIAWPFSKTITRSENQPFSIRRWTQMDANKM